MTKEMLEKHSCNLDDAPSDDELLDLDLSRSESENSRLRYQMDLKETIFDGSNGNDVRYDSERI